MVEAADWVVWQLTGIETRNSCTAGYKALWDADDGFPASGFFEALEPGFGTVVDDKMSRSIASIGRTGRRPVPGGRRLDGPAEPGSPSRSPMSTRTSRRPAATVTAPGTLVAIMGTSICHVVLSDEAPAIAGMCGVVRDGVIPGFYGYEAGQPAVGDLFGWFVERGVPPSFHEEAERRGVTVHEVLADSAATLRPGESGLLALDWWNGNRSVLVDADLTGVLIGMTLATERAGDLSSPHRSDGVRHPGHHRRVRGGRRPDRSASSPAAGSRIAARC